MKKRFYLSLLLCLLLSLTSCGNFVWKALRSTYLSGHITATTDDAKRFHNNTIQTTSPTSWTKHPAYNTIPLNPQIDDDLKDQKTISFLIIKDGKLLFEKYYDNTDTFYASNSFSMAKSITALLLGCALKEGAIKSLDQPITDFLPEYQNDSFARLATVKSLATMSNGYDWNENYFTITNPTTKAYYGNNLDKVIFSQKFIETPNQYFKYLSGTTQLLGYVIKRATKKTLAEYATQKLWQPLHMETNALWTLDHQGGTEKAFCCIHSHARDFAKLGQLLLQNGNWKGLQILDSTYVAQATKPQLAPHYGFSIWMDYDNTPPFYLFRGHLGQYVIIVPSHNMVIVRLGKSRQFRHNPNPKKPLPLHIYNYVDAAIQMSQNIKNQ